MGSAFKGEKNVKNSQPLNYEILPEQKIVVIGDSSVGKTTMIHKYKTEEFNRKLPHHGSKHWNKDYTRYKIVEFTRKTG